MFRTNAQTLDSNITILATENANVTGPLTITSGVTIDYRKWWKARNNMSEIFVDTIQRLVVHSRTDIRVKNTSVYESDGGTMLTERCDSC